MPRRTCTRLRAEAVAVAVVAVALAARALHHPESPAAPLNALAKLSAMLRVTCSRRSVWSAKASLRALRPCSAAILFGSSRGDQKELGVGRGFGRDLSCAHEVALVILATKACVQSSNYEIPPPVRV